MRNSIYSSQLILIMRFSFARLAPHTYETGCKICNLKIIIKKKTLNRSITFHFHRFSLHLPPLIRLTQWVALCHNFCILSDRIRTLHECWIPIASLTEIVKRGLHMSVVQTDIIWLVNPHPVCAPKRLVYFIVIQPVYFIGIQRSKMLKPRCQFETIHTSTRVVYDPKRTSCKPPTGHAAGNPF